MMKKKKMSKKEHVLKDQGIETFPTMLYAVENL